MAESIYPSRAVPTERTIPSDTEYVFGQFRMSPHRGLTRNGELIHLPPKELALLTLLLRAEGAIVSNEEIEAKLWPRQIISHASVVRCVYSLRKLLGGRSDDHITTEPKRGYRLTRPPTRLPPRYTALSASARAYFEEGLREANRSQDAAHERALGLFGRAHALDPDSPEPPLAMAETYVQQMNRGVLRPREASRRAQEVCDLALV